MRLSDVLRALRHGPLAGTGLVQRFWEDPARGTVALRRAVPGLARFARAPVDPATRVHLAVAQDRLVDADAAFAQMSPGGSEYEACALAIALARGDVEAVATARPLGWRSRRIVRSARRVQAEVGEEVSFPPPSAVPRPSRESIGREPVIVHVVTNSLPLVQAGSTIRTQRVVRAQRDLGWAAIAVTRPGFPVLRGDLVAQSPEVVDGVPYHRLLPTVMPGHRHFRAAYARLLGDLVRSLRPDVLHAASDHVNASAALMVGRQVSLPVAYEVRAFPEDSWLAKHRYPGAQDSDLYRFLRARHDEVILASDVLTTLGMHMRDALIERGADPARVVVVPNAVDQPFTVPVRERSEARERIGVEGGELLIGSVTTMYSYEGLHTIIDSAAIMRRRGLDVRVMIVGEGPERPDLLRRASAGEVPVFLPGRVPHADVRDYFDALDVFCLPRVDDRVTRLVTGLKPLEAQARALPVVGSDLPAVAEVLAPGSDLVPAGAVEAWAAVLEAYSDQDLRARRGAAAREWVLATRTWPAVVEGYRAAYRLLGLP